jgi:hypothetical protein
MALEWPQSRVRFEKGCLVVAAPAYERPSEAPEIPGIWMQYATCGGGDGAIRRLASRYGFLRAPGETLASWRAFLLLLGLIARPWTTVGNLDALTELPAPGIGSAAAVTMAHAYARELRQQTLTAGDIGLDAGDVSFQMAPRNLAGALALQAATALLERPGFRRCGWEHHWFQVGRADQRYCTQRHRLAAFKDKEKKA